jgi:hypothetical protein
MWLELHANSVKTLLQTSKLQSLIWYKEQYASRQCARNAIGLCLSLSEVYCSIYAPGLGQSAANKYGTDTSTPEARADMTC